MKKIDNFTKVEFLEEYSLEKCPTDFDLRPLVICQEGADDIECKRCWEEAIKGVKFKSPIEVFKEKNITILDELRLVEEQYNMLKVGRDKLKEELLKQMEIHGVDKFENDKMVISYVKGSTGKKFDGAKFKKDYPDIYKEYEVAAIRAASVRFKVK